MRNGTGITINDAKERQCTAVINSAVRWGLVCPVGYEKTGDMMINCRRQRLRSEHLVSPLRIKPNASSD